MGHTYIKISFSSPVPGPRVLDPLLRGSIPEMIPLARLRESQDPGGLVLYAKALNRTVRKLNGSSWHDAVDE